MTANHVLINRKIWLGSFMIERGAASPSLDESFLFEDAFATMCAMIERGAASPSLDGSFLFGIHLQPCAL